MRRSPEARLFRAYWEDGALDLVAGAAVVLIGLGHLFGQVLVPVVVAPLAFAVWLGLRGRVVEPRSGYVEFSRRRRDRSARQSLMAVALGIGFLTLFLVLAVRAKEGAMTLPLAVGADGGGPSVDAVPALLVALATLVAAWLTGAWRFAVYAAVMVVAGVATVLVGSGPGLPLIVGGLVVSGTGVVLFGRFMRESARAMGEE